jgi:hypothetical protein
MKENKQCMMRIVWGWEEFILKDDRIFQHFRETFSPGRSIRITATTKNGTEIITRNQFYNYRLLNYRRLTVLSNSAGYACPGGEL